jgi:hypothetical protein
VDIYHLTVDGVGLATVADSFAAIEQRVVKEQRLTWEELKQHLDKRLRRRGSHPPDAQEHPPLWFRLFAGRLLGEAYLGDLRRAF